MTLLRTGSVRSPAPTEGVSTRRFVAWVCLGVVAFRAAFVMQPLRSDEGGYLLVARQWRSGGEFLYGDYFVDRPPLLLAIFRLAALSDWDPAIRVITIPFALLFVVAASWAGFLIAGRDAARWSALVAAGVMCSPALAADQADGELFAVPLVMTSVALTLAIWRMGGSGRFWLSVAAGVFASAASLVKQSFLEGFVFAGGLLMAELILRRGTKGRYVLVVAGMSLGALAPYAIVWTWASTRGFDGATIWADFAGFRGAAFEVIWGNSPQASITRGARLLVLTLVSGVLPVVGAWVVSCRSALVRGCSETWAIGCALAFGLAAIIAGGSYWPHYLLQLAPMVSLAAGIVAVHATTTGRWMRGASRVVVGSAVAGSLVIGLVYVAVPRVWFQQRTGEWLAGSSVAGDTAFVAYGHPSVLEAADLGSPYPHLWSLPMRTLDPRQDRLRATVAGPDAPSWIVEVNRFNAWDIDADSRLRDLVADRYRSVGSICGHAVWLRRDLDRRLAAPPLC